MSKRSRLPLRMLPLLTLAAIVLLCGVLAAALLGWTPGARGIPADIAAIQPAGNR
jgi:hypothetical protein